MRNRFSMALIAAAALSVSTYVVQSEPGPPHGDLGFIPNNKRGKGQNNRRGKGKRSVPKKRSNRLIISKRVRRKHRRAA